jgi:hypothetical protein
MNEEGTVVTVDDDDVAASAVASSCLVARSPVEKLRRNAIRPWGTEVEDPLDEMETTDRGYCSRCGLLPRTTCDDGWCSEDLLLRGATEANWNALPGSVQSRKDAATARIAAAARAGVGLLLRLGAMVKKCCSTKCDPSNWTPSTSLLRGSSTTGLLNEATLGVGVSGFVSALATKRMNKTFTQRVVYFATRKGAFFTKLSR